MTGSFASFVDNRTVLGSTLVVPVRVLWWDYLSHCKRWGFEAEDAEHFVKRMLMEEGVKIRAGGCGRLRRCFEGIGLNAGSIDGQGEAA